MIRTHIFNDEITIETVTKLIAELESDLQEEVCVKLYFSSLGGHVCAREILVEFLNDWKDSIILVGYNELASAGFLVFAYFEGEKRITIDTWGMAHITGMEQHTRRARMRAPEIIASDTILAEIERVDYQKISNLLTPDQQRMYLAGEDVYFDCLQLKTMFDL